MVRFLNKKKSANLLEMTPILNGGFRIEQHSGHSFLIVPRTAFIEKIAIKIFKQAKEHRYQLDELGHCVLENCNGEKTVAEIAELLSGRFGAAAEPILPRLVKFLEILDTNSIVTLQGAG